MTMKRMIFFLLTCISIASHAQNTKKEKVVKAYYMGFEKNDWNAVASQLADGFTFTSPNNDNHISIEEFKKKSSLECLIYIYWLLPVFLRRSTL